MLSLINVQQTVDNGWSCNCEYVTLLPITYKRRQRRRNRGWAGGLEHPLFVVWGGAATFAYNFQAFHPACTRRPAAEAVYCMYAVSFSYLSQFQTTISLICASIRHSAIIVNFKKCAIMHQNVIFWG